MTMRDRPAMPPTTPPAMAPALDRLLGVGVVVPSSSSPAVLDVGSGVPEGSGVLVSLGVGVLVSVVSVVMPVDEGVEFVDDVRVLVKIGG